MDVDTQNAVDALYASIDGLTNRVQGTQADLKAQRDKVAELQAQVDAGNTDPALVQALTDAKARLDQIDVNNDAPLPDNPEPLAASKQHSSFMPHVKSKP